ncbi:transcription factor S [Methanobacterium paludis]|uniref:Transcription factor S n=1 Tax=Methanobacterium paludis (strain DSM 25820 / JCM 18151 / SWAN1) TaxID=868131 RepID=F6D506_METPW|nr:transcription factor S [Methanobacterium paludis]AEG19285.1 transcription termination factor Tfs [Methanobacterium paludis]
MEFCPKCGTVMFPQGDCFECKKCGYKEDITKESMSEYKVSEKVKAKESIIFTSDDIQTLPTTKAICPKCKNKEASWWLQQTRRADESETRFLRCTKCGYTWREYD